MSTRTSEPVRRLSLADRWRKTLRRHWQLYLLIIPPLAYFAIFKYLPMLNAVIAFKDYNVVAGIWGSEWVGLKHFNSFFGNPVFWPLIRNTLHCPATTSSPASPSRSSWLSRSTKSGCAPSADRADGHLRAVLHLDRRHRLDDDPHPLAAARASSAEASACSASRAGSPRRADYFRHIYVWSDVWQTAGYSAVIYLAALAGDRPDALRGGQGRRRIAAPEDLARRYPRHHAHGDDHPDPERRKHHGDRLRKGLPAAEPAQSEQSEIIATYVYKTGLLNANFSSRPRSVSSTRSSTSSCC